MRRFLKAVLPPLALVVFLSLLLGFAWLSQNPDSPHLEKAQEWPVVGSLAQRFREAYLGTGAGDAGGRGGVGDDDSEKDGGETVVVVRMGADGKPLREKQLSGEEPLEVFASPVSPERGRERSAASRSRRGETREPTSSTGTTEEASTGSTLAEALVEGSSRKRGSRRKTSAPVVSPAAVVAQEKPAYLAQEWTWFLPGQTIRTGPRVEAPARVDLVSMAWLPVLGRRGSWAEVVYDGERCWIDTSWEPPHPKKGARRGLLRHRHEPVRSSDWGDLVRARKILDLDEPTRKLGAYELLTDVKDAELLEFLDHAAVAAEEAYFARFGRLPSGNPGRTVVLFAERGAYREFTGDDSPVVRHMGHARSGTVVFFAEGESRQELGRTLVHEIGHLLNDRALAWRLPPWLEEGLATDLGSVWVESSGMVRDPLLDQRSFVLQGPDARLLHLGRILEDKGLPPLAALMSLDYETFHQEGLIESWAYAQSVAFVRYLLDGEDRRHRAGFLEFLKKIAGGYGADPRLLLKLLDLDLEELERGFRTWLREEIQAAGVRRDRQARRMAAR